MNKAVVIGVGLGLGCVALAVHHCRADKPPVTYQLEGFPSPHYTLAPKSELGAIVTLAYDTPCGKKTADIRVHDDDEPDDDGVVLVRYPADQRMPALTHVRLDPKLTGSAKLGLVTLDRETEVLDAQCGAHLTIDDRDVGELPIREVASVTADTGARVLFVTARTDTCFADLVVHYRAVEIGHPHPDVKIHMDANAYWLAHASYDFWFKPIPASLMVLTSDFEASRAAFDECDTIAKTPDANEEPDPTHPRGLVPTADQTD